MTIRCDLFSLMKNLSLALDFNREGINDHHRKVAFVAYILGEQIGLSLSEKSNLLYMGLIHDIGVSSWSEKDALSKFNFEELQDHCIRGYDFLQNSYFENFAPIILSHHDYYRGGNFTKLKGEEIPFLSRILFVADRVAITFNPNVNPIEQSGKIIEKITLNKWTLFDPLVVEKFVEVAKREEFWLILGTDEILNMSLNEFPKEQKDLGINEIKSLARLFAKLIDQKSRFTFYHSQMVAAVAAFVAELLGYSFDNFEMIEVAGLLHDLGKLSVPLEILEKPGKLMSEEFIYIRQHTFFTYYLLKNVSELQY
jgi:HD-GYP domain-containing protein (c-di-GMP phosphodiesterase class II)